MVTLIGAACRHPAGSNLVSDQAQRKETVVVVQTDRLRLGSIAQRISVPASLVARRQSHIGVQVPGRILHVHVSEGDRVEAGAPLFEIDPDEYEMAVRQATAGLELAHAQRAQVEADLARAQSLRKRNVLPEQEIERLATALAVARATERQAEEALALARHNLDRTVVRAPYAGSIAARLADEGTTALVQPQTIVVVLQETAELEGHAAIPESQLSLIHPGNRVLVYVEGLPDPIESTISAVSDTIDAATRTYLVKMPVPNPEYRLKAGVFARVEIFPEPKADTLVAPRESIRTEEGRPRLLTVQEGVAVAVPVELGVTSEEMVEIVRGAQLGDEVVVGNAARTLAPGMRVSVVNPPEDQGS